VAAVVVVVGEAPPQPFSASKRARARMEFDRMGPH